MRRDINDEIDEDLKKLYEARAYKMFAHDLYEDFMTNVAHATDRIMLDENLITAHHESRMLTLRGIEISQLGGWKKYLSMKSEKDRMENKTQADLQSLTKQQLELNIREMKVNFTQIKNWFWIWIISIMASSVLGAWFQSLLSK
jgi:hypothetical protein